MLGSFEYELGPNKGRTVYYVLLPCRDLNPSRALYPPHQDFSEENMRVEWMIENCPSRVVDNIDYTTAFWRAQFYDNEDAILFYLRWGQASI